MAARFVGCAMAMAQVFRPGMIRRCSQLVIGSCGLAKPPTGLRSLSSTSSAWRMRYQYAPVALGQPLLRSYCSTPLTDVYTPPPQPLARETPSVGQGFSTLAKVQVDLERKQLHVSWDQDGIADCQAYPFVWLRDNCHCPQCFHPIALGRRQNAQQHYNVDATADVVEISPDERSVSVQWDDGHKSKFLSHWLRYYRFDQSPVDQLLNPKPRLWGSDVTIKCFDFDEILAEDHALYGWLAELVTVGVAVLKNAPTKVGQLHKLAERVAYLQTTLYGITLHVISKPDPNNIAYTTDGLMTHTDFAFYSSKPVIGMLHCIQAAAEGGENFLVDGFRVAMDLKKSDPEAYRLLTTYPFEYSQRGSDCFGRFYLHSQRMVIELNELGEVKQITISDYSRDPMLRAPVDQVLPIYSALEKYFNMLQLPEYQLQYKMQEGDVLTMDNRRVLHGRNAYRVTETNARHIEGAYIEWDEINSRLRTLAVQLQKNTTSE